MFAETAKALTLIVGALTSPIAPCSPVGCYNPAQSVLTATEIAGAATDGLISVALSPFGCRSGIGAFPVCLPAPSRKHR